MLQSSMEASIDRYKEEYAGLIGETEAIKGEMKRVESKVDRSMKLLESLSSEKTRWEDDSRRNGYHWAVGDVLFSAAFLAYAGFFDQQYREMMWQERSAHLSEARIKFKAELSLPDHLSTADDRLSWQSKGLPSDTLCIENAIMIKIQTTSFLDEKFPKVLESALRKHPSHQGRRAPRSDRKSVV